MKKIIIICAMIILINTTILSAKSVNSLEIDFSSSNNWDLTFSGSGTINITGGLMHAGLYRDSNRQIASYELETQLDDYINLTYTFYYDEDSSGNCGVTQMVSLSNHNGTIKEMDDSATADQIGYGTYSTNSGIGTTPNSAYSTIINGTYTTGFNSEDTFNLTTDTWYKAEIIRIGNSANFTVMHLNGTVINTNTETVPTETLTYLIISVYNDNSGPSCYSDIDYDNITIYATQGCQPTEDSYVHTIHYNRTTDDNGINGTINCGGNQDLEQQFLSTTTIINTLSTTAFCNSGHTCSGNSSISIWTNNAAATPDEPNAVQCANAGTYNFDLLPTAPSTLQWTQFNLTDCEITNNTLYWIIIDNPNNCTAPNNYSWPLMGNVDDDLSSDASDDSYRETYGYLYNITYANLTEGEACNASIQCYDATTNTIINTFTILARNLGLGFDETYNTTAGQINVSDTNMTANTNYDITFIALGYQTIQYLNYNANSILNQSMQSNNMTIILGNPVFADRWNQNTSQINFTYQVNGTIASPTCYLYTSEAGWAARANQTTTINTTNGMQATYSINNTYEGNLTWNIMCNVTGQESWGANGTIVIDQSVPGITISQENFDATGDTTTLSVWDNITFNITMTDTYLHSYEINCTLYNGTIWINDYNENLNTTNYSTYISKSLANISVNNYEPLTCQGIAWDDHTDNKWTPKNVEVDTDEIKVDQITVKLDNWLSDNTPTYTIKNGKVSYEFTGMEEQTNYVFNVFCDDEDFRHRPFTEYEAHFTCGKQWIDFENPSDEKATVKEKYNYFGLGRKYYEVEIEAYNFDSIGGLNNNTFDFSINISSDVYINLTREGDYSILSENLTLTLDGITDTHTQNFTFQNVTQMYNQLTGTIGGVTIVGDEYINTTGLDNYTANITLFYPEISFIDANNRSTVTPNCTMISEEANTGLPNDYDYANWNSDQTGTLSCFLWAYEDVNQSINFSQWNYTNIEVRPKYLNLTFTSLINGSIIGTDPTLSYTLTNTNNTYYEMRNLSSGLNIVTYGPSLQLYHFTNDYNTTYEDTLTVITADLEKPIAVYSTYGEAIEDAYVVSSLFVDGEWRQTYSTYTDGDGLTNHKYDDNNVYLITVTADGYVTHTEATYIATGDTNTLAIYMVPTTAGDEGWCILVNNLKNTYTTETNYTAYLNCYDENVNVTIEVNYGGTQISSIEC